MKSLQMYVSSSRNTKIQLVNDIQKIACIALKHDILMLVITDGNEYPGTRKKHHGTEHSNLGTWFIIQGLKYRS